MIVLPLGSARRLWAVVACVVAFFSSSARVRANAPGGGDSGSDVTMQEMGDRVMLSNGILSATINKGGASVASLRYKGQEMASTVYYSMDGGENYRTPTGCIFSVKTRTPDLIDVSCKRIWKNEPQAFDIDVHYVLKRGATGLYSYAVLDHPANYPATGYGEWRSVWKLSNDLLEKIYVDDLRHWQMPSSQDYKTATPTGIKEIVKLNAGVRAGQYDCKYDFSASYYDMGCWGHASDKNKIGGWIVCGGYDFFNDGPTKQDLNAASGINHIHFGMNHYNGSNPKIAQGENWQKIYGPFLLYCNSNPQGGDAMWADAKAQVQAEKAAWPYTWLTNTKAYPSAKERGAVSGQFVVKDPLKPAIKGANAWIGVAQPEPNGNWQFESKRYQYWVKTGADGSFTIPNVRPGSYTLSAFLDGEVGEFTKTGVNVSAGQNTPLGNLTWEVPRKSARFAWEIGVPDRTAKEFRHGKDYFHGYVWQNFAKEMTNPLVYTVGKSDPAKDWNYAQSQYAEEGKPVVPHRWRIDFNLPSAPSGASDLTLAIASADRARIAVYLNNDNQPLATVSPSVQGGNALLRESIHAKYCVEHVSIPSTRLRSGANSITLVQTSVSGAGLHVMYDYLSLETP